MWWGEACWRARHGRVQESPLETRKPPPDELVVRGVWRARPRPARSFLSILGSIALLGIMTLPSDAHHGGLGIEGDIIAWSLKVDQWQQESMVEGYRIKFLAYPRNAIANRPTRLVFEVQSVATGHYIGGLIAEVMIRSAGVEEHRLAALEIPGVTAYYELVHSFPRPGTYSIAIHAQADGRELTATFVQPVSANPLFGDWATMLGNGVILAVCMATWIGAVLALQRRLPM